MKSLGRDNGGARQRGPVRVPWWRDSKNVENDFRSYEQRML